MLNCRAVIIACVLSATIIPDAYAQEQGSWMLRTRALGVIPSEDASITGAITGSAVAIDNSVVPEIDVTYFLNKHFALELIAATTPHDVTAKGTSAGDIDLGSSWLLPPTLTLQYHFEETNHFKPYIGAGINYTHFWNVDKSASITNIKYDDSVGPALQAGVDYMLDEHWLVNLDVKKIWINTDVSINNNAIRADVDINPWIVGMGVGYRF